LGKYELFQNLFLRQAFMMNLMDFSVNGIAIEKEFGVLVP
jgi:hypothetical protein